MTTQTNAGRVEFYPFGISLLEREGIPFTDRVEGADTVRQRVTPPTSGQVSIKTETDEGGGPVYIDGIPLAEICFDSQEAADPNDIWTAMWYTRPQAKRMAKALGCDLGES